MIFLYGIIINISPWLLGAKRQNEEIVDSNYFKNLPKRPRNGGAVWRPELCISPPPRSAVCLRRRNSTSISVRPRKLGRNLVLIFVFHLIYSRASEVVFCDCYAVVKCRFSDLRCGGIRACVRNIFEFSCQLDTVCLSTCKPSLCILWSVWHEGCSVPGAQGDMLSQLTSPLPRDYPQRFMRARRRKRTKCVVLASPVLSSGIVFAQSS